MIIVLKPNAAKEQVDAVVEKIKSLGLTPMISKGIERTIIGVIGEEGKLRVQPLEIFPGVESVVPILKPYKLVSRDFKPEDSVIDLGKGVKIGGKKLVIMAGPCSVENFDLLLDIASKIKASGATVLRGGAFKPRTSPYSFQGLGEQGLKYLHEVGQKTGLLVVTELMDPRDLSLVEKYADIIQIGARNIQNYTLLKEVGKSKKPVLLKRGMMSTVKEWLMSAEYILASGNFNVILCERGIRTFEDSTRFTFDVNAVPVVKQLTHLPIIVDPSHATGKCSLVPAASYAGIAAGADGLIVEVHPNPKEALSDGDQSLHPENFEQMIQKIRKIAKVLDREV